MPKRKITPNYIADHIRRVLKDGGSAPHSEEVQRFFKEEVHQGFVRAAQHGGDALRGEAGLATDMTARVMAQLAGEPVVLAPRELPQAAPPPARPRPSQATPVLEIKDLTVRFEGLTALANVSIALAPGETVSIIGANGAGKTTLFNAITGFVRPTEGEIRYLGGDISAVPPYRRARLGLARTFQIPRLMPALTVWENVLIASRHGGQAHRAVEHTAWAIQIMGLGALWREPVARLSPGHQRQLEFARALGLWPQLVLLDEVMAGMTGEERELVREAIRRLPEFGVAAVACVEHVIAAVADLSDRMVVLDFGKKIADATPEEVLRDPAVVRAYLGEPL
jgi:ABC-type branched-subunit amino acid transport system ATPase component